NFGDGTTAATTVPMVVTDYDTGATRVVQVMFTPSATGCETQTTAASTSVVIPACVPGSGGGAGATGESTGCLLLRWSILLAVALSELFLMLYLCQFHIPLFLDLSLAFGALAAALFFIWLLVCYDRCTALTLAWQVPLVSAIVTAFFAGCCGRGLFIGAAAL